MRSSLVLLVFLLGCGTRGGVEPSPEGPAPEDRTEAPNTQRDPPPLPSNDIPLPSGHPPLEGAPPPPMGTAIVPTGLAWEAPAPFVARPPASPMRTAEYGLDGVETAELAVFYFGEGQGGSVEDNVSRWVGQISQPDGSETHAERTQRTVNGVEVTLVSATGTIGASTMGRPMPERPDSMLLGAIATGPRGPVFFKLTGPREAIEHARSAFDALVASIHPG